jgi:hypothetical protein
MRMNYTHRSNFISTISHSANRKFMTSISDVKLHSELACFHEGDSFLGFPRRLTRKSGSGTRATCQALREKSWVRASPTTMIESLLFKLHDDADRSLRSKSSSRDFYHPAHLSMYLSGHSRALDSVFSPSCSSPTKTNLVVVESGMPLV